MLADIFMPGKNGYELCETIKESAQFRNVPVVLLVGAFEPFDQTEAKRVKADAHLTKPFESRTLVETVRRLISAMPRQTTAPIVPAADSAHDEAFDAHEPLEPFEAKLDLTEMADTNEPLATRVRNTGELVSHANEVLPGVFDLGAVDAPVPDAVSTSLTDTTERFEPLEFSPTGEFARADITPSYNPGVEQSPVAEMIKDFDTPALSEDSGSEDPISFGTKPSSSFVVETGRVEGESWFDPDTFENPGPSKSSNDDAWRVSSNGSALSYQSPVQSANRRPGIVGPKQRPIRPARPCLRWTKPLGDAFRRRRFGKGRRFRDVIGRPVGARRYRND